MAKSIKRYTQCLWDIPTLLLNVTCLTCDLLHSVKQLTIFIPKSMIYALAHFTKTKTHYRSCEVSLYEFKQKLASFMYIVK